MMTRPVFLRRRSAMPPIFWKMIISSACGGAVYLVSDFADQPVEWSVLLSTFTGGIVLVAQFLVDFDRDLRHIVNELALHNGNGKFCPEKLPGNQFSNSDLLDD